MPPRKYVTARQYVVTKDKDGKAVALPPGSRLPATDRLVKANPKAFEKEKA